MRPSRLYRQFITVGGTLPLDTSTAYSKTKSHFQPYLFVLAPGLPEAPKGSAPGVLVYRAAAQYLTGDSFGAYRLARDAAQADPSFWPAILLQALADGTTEPPLGLLWSHGVFARRSPEQAQSVLETLNVAPSNAIRAFDSLRDCISTLGELDNAFVALERAAGRKRSFPALPF